jgi:hypothetical protein
VIAESIVGPMLCAGGTVMMPSRLHSRLGCAAIADAESRP